MNILFLSQLFCYPPDSGAKIRTLQTLRALAAHHSIALLAFIRDKRELDYLPRVEQYCEEVQTCLLGRGRARDAAALLRAALSGRPAIIERDFHAEMEAMVGRALMARRFDVIHLDRLHMAQYVPGRVDAQVVLDEQNIESDIARQLADCGRGPARLFWRWEWGRLRRFEAQAASRADHIICLSEDDRAALESLIQPESGGARPRLHVVPIGVDTEEIAPARNREDGPVVFIGDLKWPPNADGVCWFVREIWPKIRERRPGARFRIIGANAPRSVRRLGHRPGVELAGYADDIRPELARARAMVVPLRAGGGVRVKILTAFAAGLPVVATPIGYAGIAAEESRHLLAAEAPEDFAAAVAALLEDDALCAALAESARRLVEEHYARPHINEKMLAAYDAIAAAAREPARVGSG